MKSTQKGIIAILVVGSSMLWLISHFLIRPNISSDFNLGLGLGISFFTGILSGMILILFSYFVKWFEEANYPKLLKRLWKWLGGLFSKHF